MLPTSPTALACLLPAVLLVFSVERYDGAPDPVCVNEVPFETLGAAFVAAMRLAALESFRGLVLCVEARAEGALDAAGVAAGCEGEAPVCCYVWCAGEGVEVAEHPPWDGDAMLERDPDYEEFITDRRLSVIEAIFAQEAGPCAA